MRCWLGALISAALAAGCASTPPTLAVQNHSAWQAEEHRAHPLVGVIWHAKSRQAVTFSALVDESAQSRYVLLGERHDNPDHQRLAVELARSLNVKATRSLALEALDHQHQAALSAAQARPVDVEAIADAAQHDRKGWRWPRYRPVLAAALQSGMPLIAANLSRADARRVMQSGFAAVPEVARVTATHSWSQTHEAALVEELVASHCGQLGRGFAAQMAKAQRARDVVIAQQMLSAVAGVVLLAGSGHVRRDRGVPSYLAPPKPLESGGQTGQTGAGDESSRRSVSIAFQEVEPLRNQAQEYPSADPAVFDYIWFTPAAKRDDPCANVALPAAAKP